MSDFPESAMVALLPIETDWCHIELPHMTLVYCGEIPNLSPGTHNDLAKMTLSLALTCPPMSLDVMSTDVFGDTEEDRVDVLRLRPTPQLLAMRHQVEQWNASQHPFNPHATVGPAGIVDGSDIPTRLSFDRIMVGWGDQQDVFWLKG